jgi:hypothetical protein
MKTLDSSNNDNEHGTKRKSKFTEPVYAKKQKTISQLEINYNCAYDALFTIFYHIWIHNPTECDHPFKKIKEP